MKKELIRNVLDVDVDGLKGINYYRVSAMYNVINEEGYADIVQEVIEEFCFTWDEIERKGGIGKLLAEIKETYDIEEGW